MVIGQVLLCLAARAVVAFAEDVGAEGTCAAGGGSGCIAMVDTKTSFNATECSLLGFDANFLMCDTCAVLRKRLDEAGATDTELLYNDCVACCKTSREVVRFRTARMMADASIQDSDTDVHDFIKRKAPLFPTLEVEYKEGQRPCVEFEDPDDDNRVLRADVAGWSSDNLFEFLSMRLEKAKETQADEGEPSAAWTAEVQTCSG
jgi:hypothetical protein